MKNLWVLGFVFFAGAAQAAEHGWNCQVQVARGRVKGTTSVDLATGKSIVPMIAEEYSDITLKLVFNSDNAGYVSVQFDETHSILDRPFKDTEAWVERLQPDYSFETGPKKPFLDRVQYEVKHGNAKSTKEISLHYENLRIETDEGKFKIGSKRGILLVGRGSESPLMIQNLWVAGAANRRAGGIDFRGQSGWVTAGKTLLAMGTIGAYALAEMTFYGNRATPQRAVCEPL